MRLGDFQYKTDNDKNRSSLNGLLVIIELILDMAGQSVWGVIMYGILKVWPVFYRITISTPCW